MEIQSNSEKTRKIICKCKEMGIEVSEVSINPQVLKLRRGSKSVFLYKQHLPINVKNAVLLANNKYVTKVIMAENGICAPKGIIAKEAAEALECVRREGLRYPLVSKPIDGSCGVGITVDINNEDALLAAIDKIRIAQLSTKMLKDHCFIVEEMVKGKDHRVLVLDGKMIACVERVPAEVVGNGISSIVELVNKFNLSRPKQFCIVLDEDAINLIKRQGFLKDDILSDGEKVQIRKNANVSMGGIPVDRTREVSKRFEKICIDAAKLLGLSFAGIDLYVEDISSEDESQIYNIIEVNGNLIDYDIHEKPLVQGEGVDICRFLLERLFL